MSNPFWEIYSKPYLRLKNFVPHQQLAQRVLDLVDIREDKKYLDAGCGPGLLIRDRANVVGIDFSHEMLEAARHANPHATFSHADLNGTLPFTDGTFDAVYSNNVLAYLKKPEATLAEFRRVLKPGGKLVLSTLRRSFNPFRLLQEHFKSGHRITTIKSFLVMSFTILLNLRIVFKLWLGQYHGFELDGIEKAAENSGFTVSHRELAYADQNVLIVAHRD